MENYNQGNVKINIKKYYHPSFIGKIVGGLFWYIGIVIIITGLLNFTIKPIENLTQYEIIKGGVLITLFGIAFYSLGKIIYVKKYRFHFGFSFIYSIIVLIAGYKLFEIYGGSGFNGLSFLDGDFFLHWIAKPTFIFFALINILWIIRFCIYKLTGKLQGDMLNSANESHELSNFITITLFVILITLTTMGYIRFTIIPKTNGDLFLRKEHTEFLPENENGLSKLKNMDDTGINGHAELRQNLDRIQQSEYRGEDFNNLQLGWQWHSDECEKIYSGNIAYCGTWARERATIKRMLNRKIELNNGNGEKKSLEYDGKEVTIYAYIKRHEDQIKSDLDTLEQLLESDYYINNDDLLNSYPSSFQSFSRGFSVLLQYFVREKNDEMIIKIIRLNKEMANHMYAIGTQVGALIGIILENNINGTLNNLNLLLSDEVRDDIVNIYKENSLDKMDIIQQIAKGEYDLWEQAKKEIGQRGPSLYEILYHFPFYSPKDTDKLMKYFYSAIYNNNYDIERDLIDGEYKWPYNIMGIFQAEMYLPRLTANKYLDIMKESSESLVENIQAGENKEWYSEAEWGSSTERYEENMIKEY